MTTTALTAEETVTSAAVGEEGPLSYTSLAVGEEVMTTMAEGEEGPTLGSGEDISQPSYEDPAGSISVSGVENPFGGF